MATVATRTLAALCLLAIFVAGCGGDGDTAAPDANPTLTDPASVPTAIPDQERPPFRIGDEEVAPPGASAVPTVAAAQPSQTIYTVQEGDTCGAIAANFRISINELLAANPRINEDCTNLQVDWDVNIPAPDPRSVDPESDSASEPETPAGLRTYIVLPGDTCAAIAQDHDIPLPTFLVANGLDEESCITLQVGQEVIIPE